MSEVPDGPVYDYIQTVIGGSSGSSGGNNYYNPNPSGINYDWWATYNNNNVIDELKGSNDSSDWTQVNGYDCSGSTRSGNVQWPGTAEHWIIQFAYMEEHPSALREYGIPNSGFGGGRGYVDLANWLNREMYEIKPNNPAGQANGALEIANYVTKANQHCINTWFNDPPWIPGISYQTRYFNVPSKPSKVLVAERGAPGVILYSYIDREQVPQNVPLPVPLSMPTNLSDKLKGLVRVAVQTYNAHGDYVRTIVEYLRQNKELGPYLKTIAVGVMIATIIEDIVTEGVGIADDWASFVVARTIWRASNMMVI